MRTALQLFTLACLLITLVFGIATACTIMSYEPLPQPTTQTYCDKYTDQEICPEDRP